MSFLIAWRNLIHDPVRFGATLIGIIFSVALMSIQAGLLQGFSSTASGLVDHANADIWVAARGTLNVDQSVAQNDRALYKALKDEGIGEVSRFIVRYVIWKKPDGGTELIIIVGADPKGSMGQPWNIVEGSVDQLAEPSAVMIDKLYAEKLGVTRIGQEVEISGNRARIVGYTEGIRTFTQSPYVFTSYNNAVKLTDVPMGGASYFLLKAKEGVVVDELAARLRALLPSADVWTTADFAKQTQSYWIYTTGAGASLMMGAILGALVGIIIVSQTLYAATVERLSEYATLSAIGAGTGYLNAIVIAQAVISGLLGSFIGMAIAYAIVALAQGGGPAILVSLNLAASICFGAVMMCVVSSVLAIRKLMRIDPTSVFR